MGEWRKTSCGLCLQCCGLEVKVENNTIVKVRPDKDNLRSRGYVCRKGLNIAFLQHHRQRLERPLRAENGGWKPLEWEDALAEISGRLKDILDRHGPRSVALVAGGSGGCQLGGRFSGRLLLSLGSKYLYTALGQEWTGRHYVRGKVYGDQPLFVHPDHERLDLLLALGWNGWSSHGMPQTRRFLKELSQDSGRLLIVVDPRPSETARHADIHLALTPGSDALLLKSMIAIILDQGWHDGAFLNAHVNGVRELANRFADFPVKEALKVCGLEFEQVKDVCRLFAGRKSAVMSDLGVLMNRHSTLVSYLEEVLLCICGRIGANGGNVFTGTLSPMGVDTPSEDPNTWRTTATDIPAIMGIFPPNVLPEEITSRRKDRLRAVIVVGANPLRSYADTAAYERAFKALDLLVVVDVAMSETAAMAHYVLPGRTAYESYDTSFWSFNYPEIFFQLRRPVVEPKPETRETGWIMTSLAENLGVMPDIPPSLCRAAAEERSRFTRELDRFVRATPGAELKLPFILARTLGPVLGSNHLALLWGLLWSAPKPIRGAMARSEFGEDADRVYDAILEHPEGVWLGKLDPDKNLDFVKTADGRIRLYVPELMEQVTAVTPESEADELAEDPDYPLILMAGYHYDYNANTLMRDPDWNKGKRAGRLAVNPADAETLDLKDGDSAWLTTKMGKVVVKVQISGFTRPGMVLLPHGFGLDYDGRTVGVNVNALTRADHRDPVSAIPLHRRVTCRLEKEGA